MQQSTYFVAIQTISDANGLMRCTIQAKSATKVLETGSKLYDTRHPKSLIFARFLRHSRGTTMDIPILIQKHGGSRYGVTVPDIPGCVCSGETVDKAMSNATKAIYGHVGQLVEQGKAF